MALTDESGSGMVMPVAPMGGYGGGYGNNGFFGGDGAWILLLLLLGWGNNGWGGGFDGGAGGLYPWLNNSQNINDGFREQLLNDNVISIRDGISNIGTQLCNGFAGVNAGVANGFSQAEIAANGRQMANMNQNFGMQTVMMQGFNQLGSDLANCCCENRLGLANLGADIAREACATRTSDTQNAQTIINAINGGIQSIKDQIFADRLDDEKRENANLRQELMFARGQASQDVQTAALRQSDAVTANELLAELRACPIPSMPVYGQTPIFTCNGNNGCGCGGNAFYN